MTQGSSASPSRAAPTASRALLIVALLGPLALVLGVFGARFGVWSAEFGYRTIGLNAVLVLSILGGLAGAGGAVIAWRGGQRVIGLALVAALIVNVVIYLWVAQERNDLLTNPPVSQAASDWADRPGFSSEVMAERRGAGAQPLLTQGDAEWCPGLATVPRQAAPEEARAALEAANLQVLGVSPFRAEGRTSSFWYGFEQDVVIRIRPGATDVLVAGREDRTDGGAACRTALAVAEALAE
ncbi:DUF1499 domain-containing protein [Brevundimonas sp.]|uniref:DUF1499 domain-containing protein n=1 Tax=Brevundimonas sp. TaxID=1871086 RepID=UPI0035AEA07E